MTGYEHGDSPPMLEVSGATVRYGQIRALTDATLAVRRGRVCALLGVNGSGKSTLLKAALGQIRAGGAVRIDGQPVSLVRRAGRVAYMPQREAVDWTFPITVREVVMTGRYARLGGSRRPRQVDQEAVAAALAMVDLAELGSRQIGELSGGQRKRAFVARAIAQEPDLLLLDEPFAGVDAASERTLSRVLRRLADHGATVVMATHNLTDLAHLADEAALLARTVVMHDRPEVVLRPENLARAFALGPP